MTHPAILKANGNLPNTPLSQLRNQSITPRQAMLVADQTCLCPDYPDDEIAGASDEELRVAFEGAYDAVTATIIRGLHQSRLRATGRGSWPANCHPNRYPHSNYHCCTVWLDFDAFMRNRTINREVTDQEWQEVVVDGKVWPSLDNPVQSIAECKQRFRYGSPTVSVFERPVWRRRSNRKEGDIFTMFDMSTWLVFESFRRVGIFFYEVFTGASGSHNIHEKHIQIPGSTSGYAYFNNGTCSDHVTSNIDSLLSYSLGSLTALRTHEFGHNNNLQHEFQNPQSHHRSVMSYAFLSTRLQGFRRSGPPYEYVEDHSIPELTRFYGGEPALPISNEPPPPEPPDYPLVLPGELRATEFAPGRIMITGELEAYNQKYIACPAGGDTYRVALKPPV